jgi:hypothetical protein
MYNLGIGVGAYEICGDFFNLLWARKKNKKFMKMVNYY